MACAVDARRRILLSIIRAPSLSHQHASLRLQTQSRSFLSTSNRHNEGFSITFGPRIDELLGSKQTKGKSADKSRTRKDVLNKSIIEDNAHDSNSNKIQQTKSSAPTAINTTYSSSVVLDRNIQETDEHVTIKLSRDAYDAISRLESSDTVADRIYTETSLALKAKRSRSGARSGDKHSTVSADARQVKAPAGPSHEHRRESFKSRPAAPKGAVQGLERKPLPESRRKLEPWQIQKGALERKFGESGWNPRKKVSPDALEGIRSLHEQDPQRHTTEFLSHQFKLSPEAIRRILKSKWRASSEKMDERRQRWAKRHDRIWDQKAALGLRPARSHAREPEGPEAFEEEVHAKRALGEL